MLARVADQEPGEVNSSQMQNIVDASPHSSHYYTIVSTYYEDTYIYTCVQVERTSNLKLCDVGTGSIVHARY